MWVSDAKFFINFSKYYAFIFLEISFWNNRLKNLSFVFDQLRNERIRAMALILEHTDSAYHPCFQSLFKNVVTGNFP